MGKVMVPVQTNMIYLARGFFIRLGLSISLQDYAAFKSCLNH